MDTLNTTRTMYTEEQIHAIAKQFNERTIPADQWTHEMHLVVAHWFLDQFTFYDAYCRLKAGIILLNNAHGTPNSEDRGYHETLTWFWLHVLNLWKEIYPELTLESRCNAFLSSRIADKNMPFQFYTKEDIKDPAHRAMTLTPHRALTVETLQELLRG